MTGNEYQNLAMRTKNEELTIGEQMANACFGLAGEVGEYLDLLKKSMFQGHKLAAEKVVEELGDILWYVALACDNWEIKLDTVMEYNIEKLKKRYPDGFDSEDSINRKE